MKTKSTNTDGLIKAHAEQVEILKQATGDKRTIEEALVRAFIRDGRHDLFSLNWSRIRQSRRNSKPMPDH
jgi:hypothetical protein